MNKNDVEEENGKDVGEKDLGDLMAQLDALNTN